MEFKFSSVLLQRPFSLLLSLSALDLCPSLSVSFSPHTHIRRHTCTRAGVHTQKEDRKGTHQNVNSNCLW